MARDRRDGIGHELGGDVIGRLARDPALAGACRLLLGSNSAAMALETADLLGYRLVQSDRPGGLDVGGWLDRHRRTVEVRRGLAPLPQVSLLAHHLRHVLQDAGSVLAAYEDLPLDERLAGTYLVEADACAFQVHVAAQLARSGAPGLWSHCVSRGDAGSAAAAAAYLRGTRRGGERIGAAMAFEALASDPAFLDHYAAANAEEIAAGIPSHGPGNLRGLSTRLALASPAGCPYPDRAFAQAVLAYEARAAERPEAPPAPLRSAA